MSNRAEWVLNFSGAGVKFQRSGCQVVSGLGVKLKRNIRKYIIPKQSVVDFANGICYNGDTIINGRQYEQSSKGEQQ